LLFGSKNSQVATLDERPTRFVTLVKVAGKDSETVISALIDNAHKLPQELRPVAVKKSVMRSTRLGAIHRDL
tara:strand:- start:28895 stop:29110 length:216 start_codon:yes stop_codon:yes gene_type:complete